MTPLFALAAKATTLRTVGEGLLAAYLGADPAARILAGTVLRGEAQSVEAVLFYADLRGFTAFADALPGRELIALLDECFACMVRPVNRHGGEVLKFLGDDCSRSSASKGMPTSGVADNVRAIADGIRARLSALFGG